MFNIENVRVCLDVVAIVMSTITLIVCAALCATGKMPTDEELKQRSTKMES